MVRVRKENNLKKELKEYKIYIISSRTYICKILIYCICNVCDVLCEPGALHSVD